MILARKDRLMYWPSPRPVTHNTPLYGFLMIVQANTRYQIWEKFISEKYFSSLRQIFDHRPDLFCTRLYYDIGWLWKKNWIIDDVNSNQMIVIRWLSSDDCHNVTLQKRIGRLLIKASIGFSLKKSQSVECTHKTHTQNTKYVPNRWLQHTNESHIYVWIEKNEKLIE